MRSVAEVHNEIKELSKASNHVETRVIAEMKIGQGIRQGDVYLWKIKEIPAEFSIPTMKLQVTDGTTKGARHELEMTPSLRIFRNPNATALQGPCISSSETVSLTHPEHAHFKLPAGCYNITYQQDFASQEMRAVRD